MPENKTHQTAASVRAFIEQVAIRHGARLAELVALSWESASRKFGTAATPAPATD